MVLYVENFEHSKKLFVMHIIVKFSGFKCMRMECNQMNLFLFYHDQKDGYKYVFWCIGFHGYLSIRNLVGED